MRTIRIKVKINSKRNAPLPDYGLGEGILAYQDVDVADDMDKNVLAVSIVRIYDDLLKTTVVPAFEEIFPDPAQNFGWIEYWGDGEFKKTE